MGTSVNWCRWLEFDNDDLIFMPTSIWASSENDIWIAGENYVTMHDDDHGPIKSSRIDYFWHYNGENGASRRFRL